MPQFLVAGYLPGDFDPSQVDEAVAWGRKGVAATRGQVEIREIFFNPAADQQLSGGLERTDEARGIFLRPRDDSERLQGRRASEKPILGAADSRDV